MTVDYRDPYSFFTADLGQKYYEFKINLLIGHLRPNAYQGRFHDIKVTIGNFKPIDPLSK